MDEIKRVYAALSDRLLPWFDSCKRDLPWRKTKDAYAVWISEIMLQQTRVEAVKGYYARFLDTLPTIADLANADDALLHKLWEGLGYYSRVRNLKKAAGSIMQEHGGVFPSEYAQVIKLPGVGEYTAGAICSIVYNQPTPAVDGNVLRVIARLTNDDTPIDSPDYKQLVRRQLAAVYPERAGDFTQALMELGATVCGPNKKPECSVCPCRDICLGHKAGRVDTLPVKLPKKEKRTEEWTVFILTCNGKYALEKRGSTGLLADLWQFPAVEGTLNTEQAIDALKALDLSARDIHRCTDKKHIFTHIIWRMRGYYMEVTETDNRFQWFTPHQVEENAALPTAFRQFWEDVDV